MQFSPRYGSGSDTRFLRDEDPAQLSSRKGTRVPWAKIHNLHDECDWLLSNFQARQDARDEELELGTSVGQGVLDTLKGLF